jgi:dephospho-CoA kinase
MRKMSPEQAGQRIAAQATPAERANVADVILNSNQDLQSLLKDARRVWQLIEHEAAQRGSN